MHELTEAKMRDLAAALHSKHLDKAGQPFSAEEPG
jgi:hypothetical protein